MNKYFLSVDLGATSGRTVLSTFDGQQLQMQEWSRFANPQVPIMGHLFWDLPHLFNEILKALQKVARENIELTSIGIDTWGCDFACFGADGQLLGLPYCYRDSHTDGAPERFFEEKMPAEELYGRTGIQFMPFNSLFQLDTLQRNRATALQQAEKILFIPDALAYMLTGNAVCEYTVLSTSQMLNPELGDIDPKLLRCVGLSRSQFGTLVQPATQVGTLTAQIQDATGVGNVPVISVAGHDTASAVAAIPSLEKNYAYLSCGTWSLLGIESSKPIINKKSCQLNFTNEAGIKGTTRFLKNICGLWIFENCRKEFKDAPADVNELNAMCQLSDYDGLIQPDHQLFAHPTSMTAAIRQFCQQTGQAEPQTTADFVRCIFRSLALRYSQVLNLLGEMADFPIERLHVIGGGCLNKFLMQMTADATGLPVFAGPSEGTALGNALVQILACKPNMSLQEMRQIALNSTSPKQYLPCDHTAWDSDYEKFIKL